MKKVIVLFGFIWLVAGFAFSQVQTGTLKGKVFESESMGLLPGVLVKIESPALMVPSMERTTNNEGAFRFSPIPIGSYTVTFSLPGFKTVVRKGIALQIGVTTTLDIILETSTLQEVIEVSGQTPTVDRQATTSVAILNDDFIKQIPATRDVSNFFNMVPGVTGDTTHGSSERDNTYNLDGVNVTDPVTGTRAGSFSMDIVEEISVQTGGIAAEQGSVRGAVVNVVTKSGGSKLSGMASAYYRAKELQADNTKGTVFEGEESGFDYEIEPGFNLGGPIAQNKLWFFFNGSFQKSIQFVNGYPFNEDSNAPYDETRLFPYVKLTFQMNPDNKLVFSYNYSDLKRNHRAANYQREVDSTWIQTTPVHTINLHYTRFFGTDFHMNIKGGAMLYELNLTAKNNLPSYYDSTTREYTVSYGYDDIYRRRRFQFLTDATRFVDDWLGGDHELKAGIEVEYSYDSRYRRHNRDQYGVGPFFYTRYDGQAYYVLHYQDFTRRDRKLVIGGYLQDSWTLFDRLNINVGFRFDHQEGIIPKQGEERAPEIYGGQTYDPRVLETFKPLIWNTISPRIGLTYDVTGDGKTVIKVHWGRYYIANILQWFVTTNPNNFISWRWRLNPDFTTTGDRYSFSATSSVQMDPNLKSPYLDEFNLGIERELFKDVKLGVRYIKKWDRNLIEDVDRNALDLDALMRGDDIFTVWTNYAPTTVTDPYDNSTVTFWDTIDPSLPWLGYITNPPGAERDYDGVEVTLDKRFSNNWSMNASYVYAKSRGLIGTDFDDSWSGQPYFDSPNWHINAIGDFNAERRHQIKLQALVRGPLGINIGAYYRLLGGNRYQRTIRSLDLGLDLNDGNVSIFAEKRGSQKYPDLSILDMHLEKMFKIGKIRLSVFADVFNVFNINTATNLYELSSTSTTINGHPVVFGEAEDIYDPPRIFRLGTRIEF
jgi:outer membrane receptor protein involved in Fe transport